VPEEFLSGFVKKNLGGDQLNTVLASRFGVFPDVVKDDLHLARILGGDFLHDRLHGLAGDASVCAEFDERDEVFGKFQSRLSVTRTMPSAAVSFGRAGGALRSESGPQKMLNNKTEASTKTADPRAILTLVMF
jgi:hypothetical protein